MNTLRNTFGTWALALVTILAVSSGCDGQLGQGEGSTGLLGKVGSSLGGFKSGNGTLSLSGAAQGRGQGSGSVQIGRTDSTSDEALPPSDDGTASASPFATGGGSAGSECVAACEAIFNCLFEGCPALGTPSVDDMNAVVADCAAECEAVLDADAAASIGSMSCGAIWSELTAAEPELESMCNAEGEYGDEYEGEAEFEGEAEWSYDEGWDDYGDDSGDDWDDWDDDDSGDCGF